MKTMKIGILGHFARHTDLCDGQTVKTRNIEKALLSENENIATVDSYQWKRHPFSFLFKIINLVRKSDTIIMLPDAGGIKIYPYIVNLFAGKKRIKIYSVVGAWLPSFLKSNAKISKQLKKFTYILVETQTMKKQLEEQGFNNAVIVPNFKDITPIKETEIKYDFERPLPLCIFSRIMKKKGISDAICLCDRLNKNSDKLVCTLDIYGPLDDEYKDEFYNLCREYSSFVTYRGVINPSESVSVLKNYYMLIFPTLFYTEGIPGTVIDAFSAGLPVLASKWESYRDVLTDNDSITYEFGDTDDFYDKLKYCIENAEIINACRKECLRSAKKFSSDTATKLLSNLIHLEKNNESYTGHS